MIDKTILERYLAGNGDRNDMEAVREWFFNVGEEPNLREISLAHWDKPDQQALLNETDADHMLDRIHHMIRLQDKPRELKRNVGLRRTLRILSRIAAVLFIPMLVFLWTLREHIAPTGNQLVQTEIVCPPGTRTMFLLPDGSSGWLNGGSSLHFPTEFKGKAREVLLKGEGYFDVESSPRKPFIVKGDRVQVVAHGTVFNVLDYPDEDRSEVSLVEGSVDVMLARQADRRMLGSLTPGEELLFNSEESTVQIGRGDIEKNVAWTEGKLVFRDDSFVEVVKKCNRWYNVDMVILDKPLESYTYVGTFQDETLEEVMKLLALTAPMEYVEKGRIQRADGTFEKRKIELRCKVK